MGSTRRGRPRHWRTHARRRSPLLSPCRRGKPPRNSTWTVTIATTTESPRDTKKDTSSSTPNDPDAATRTGWYIGTAEVYEQRLRLIDPNTILVIPVPGNSMLGNIYGKHAGDGSIWSRRIRTTVNERSRRYHLIVQGLVDHHISPNGREIGACIYCGERDAPLSTEHAVPYGLNGPWTIQRASCALCAKITTALRAWCTATLMA